MARLAETIPALLQLALWFLTVALYFVLGIINRKHVARRWKPGLILSGTLLAMLVPSAVFGIFYVDLSSLEEVAYIGLAVGLCIGVVLQVIKFAWNIMLFGVAEAEWNRTGWGVALSQRHPCLHPADHAQEPRPDLARYNPA